MQRTTLPLRQSILYFLSKGLVFYFGPIIFVALAVLQSDLEIRHFICAPNLSKHVRGRHGL